MKLIYSSHKHQIYVDYDTRRWRQWCGFLSGKYQQRVAAIFRLTTSHISDVLNVSALQADLWAKGR